MELAVKGTHAATQEETSENSGLLYSVGRGKIIFSQKVNKKLCLCEEIISIIYTYGLVFRGARYF